MAVHFPQNLGQLLRTFWLFSTGVWTEVGSFRPNSTPFRVKFNKKEAFLSVWKLLVLFLIKFELFSFKPVWTYTDVGGFCLRKTSIAVRLNLRSPMSLKSMEATTVSALLWCPVQTSSGSRHDPPLTDHSSLNHSAKDQLITGDKLFRITCFYQTITKDFE